MAGEDRRRYVESIAQRALRGSKAPETEVLIIGGHEAATRFSGNGIHQNMTREVVEISIRVSDGGRTGRASTNRSDPVSLDAAAEAALSIARRLEPRDDLLPVPEPFGAYPQTACWDPATSEANPERRAAAIREVVGIASQRGLTAAGTFSSEDRYEAVANSRGLFAFGEYTSADLSTTMTGASSSGYAHQASHAMGRISAVTLAEKAAEKAILAADPGEVPPGEYTVILEPVAVGELLYHLLFGPTFCHFAALAHAEGQSYYAGRIGQKVFGENITLTDDVLHPEQWGAPFDAEGVPRGIIPLIDRGVVMPPTCDRATARRSGFTPTGHGLPVPNTVGSAPQNLVLHGGKTSIAEMIGTTQRGILVTRLWYIRLVDPADLVVTGLTRDGTFLIEDGRIVKGLRNYRFNQSLRAMLNQVTALSNVVRTVPYIANPALRVDGFKFSAIVPRES